MLSPGLPSSAKTPSGSAKAAGSRQLGHSKEGRDGNPQVVIALAVTRDGMPCSATIRMVASDNQDGYLRRRLEVCLGGLAAAGKGGSARF